MLDQPINDNAKINEADQDDWKQIKCPLIPKPVVGGNTYSDAYSEDYA